MNGGGTKSRQLFTSELDYWKTRHDSAGRSCHCLQLLDIVPGLLCAHNSQQALKTFCRRTDCVGAVVMRWLSCLACCFLTLWVNGVQCWGSKDPGKVLLRDIQVLTLRNGKMTTGKRGSPVPQLVSSNLYLYATYWR